MESIHGLESNCLKNSSIPHAHVQAVQATADHTPRVLSHAALNGIKYDLKGAQHAVNFIMALRYV